jgi:hypothetical protein
MRKAHVILTREFRQREKTIIRGSGYKDNLLQCPKNTIFYNFGRKKQNFYEFKT